MLTCEADGLENTDAKHSKPLALYTMCLKGEVA